MTIQSRARRGFTLIELLIVIVIIGILSVGLIPKVIDAPKRARDTTRKADMKSIQAALTSYYADYGKFPGDDANGALPPAIAKYLQGGKMLDDPVDTKDYRYHLDASGSCYILSLTMDVGNGGNITADPKGRWDKFSCSDVSGFTPGSGPDLYLVGGL